MAICASSRTTTVSHALIEAGVGPHETVTLLKIDVERDELNVLKGIEAADWGRISQVVVEVHESVIDETIQMLEHHNYSITINDSKFLTGSGLKLIFAVKKT